VLSRVPLYWRCTRALTFENAEEHSAEAAREVLADEALLEFARYFLL